VRKVLALATLALACGGPAKPASVEPVTIVTADASGPAAVTVARVTPDAPFRDNEPAPLATEPFVPPVAHTTRLPNGVRVVVLARPAPAIASLRIVLVGGAASQPKAPMGAMLSIRGALYTGTKSHSRPELNEAFSALFVQAPDIQTYAEDVRLSVVASADKVGPAFDLLAELVLEPTFDDALVLRGIEQSAKNLERDEQNPESGARQIAARSIFGSHPFASEWPSPAEQRALTTVDVRRAFERALDPKSLVVVATGDVDEKSIVAQAARLFGRLPPSKSPPQPISPIAPLPKSPRIVLADVPAAETAFVGFYGIAPSATASDYPATSLAMDILSRTRTSVIQARLEHELGHPVVGNQVLGYTVPGTFLGVNMTLVRAEVPKYLETVSNLLAGFGATLPDAVAVTDAKGAVVASIQSRYETSEDIAAACTGLVVQGRDASELAHLSDGYARVTPDDIRAASAKYLDPTRMRAIVVGDAATLEPALKALGWGAIEVRDAAGVVLRTDNP
jgi:zinc protease